jgi:Ca-activated chloride channel family protein
MRIAMSLAVASVLLIAGPAAQQTFRSSVQTVAVYATVSDHEGRLVPDLPRDAFQILDNGRPVEITVFSTESQHITVALMLDMSDSMVSRFLRVRQSTLHFVDALVPADRATIGTFGVEVWVSPLLTNSKTDLKRVVDQELWPGGVTPLWQALDTAMTALAGQTGRRVVFALTDGGDTGSLPGAHVGLRHVSKRARDEAFMVYAIGMEGSGLDEGMAELTEQTGGGHFELAKEADLTATFTRVTEELRRQYLVGFTPAALDGKVHKLQVRLTRPGLKARARKEYLAVSSQ